MAKIISNSVLNIINNDYKKSNYNTINIFDKTKIIDCSENNFLDINFIKKKISLLKK